MSRQLAEMLLRDKIINPAQFNEAGEAAKGGRHHIKFLIDQKYVAETKLLYYLSQKFGLPSINITKFEVSPQVIKLIPPDLAKKNQVIPIQANQGTLVVALWDPTHMAELENLKFILKVNIEIVLTSVGAFETAMSKYYGGTAFVDAAIDSFQKDRKSSTDSPSALELVQVHELDSETSAQDAPVIQLVNGILSEGIRRSASDIHIEPYEKRGRVRMRLDGVLQEIAQIPLEMKRAVAARFKIMARMDITETRVPQDGRIKLKSSGLEIDFRVNSLPTLYGEKIVLRMLNRFSVQLDLKKLGFEPKQLELFKKGISFPNGMILVTGPTGSGKTTTLYSAIAELNKATDNISTAEDPVEYNLEGINQVQVHKEVGLTFATILRALLRQDPDIVLVGEIRDFETAEVAVQAALTGHLVLSTLHTNDAASTITRLMNMGLEPYLVVAALNTIVAQRLIRMICKGCKVEQPIAAQKLIEIGFPQAEAAQMKCYRGQGCSKCDKTGYKGRIAIYEVLDFSQNLKDMVLRGESSSEIKKQGIREGMKPLRMSALTKVSEGITSLEEALSLTMED